MDQQELPFSLIRIWSGFPRFEPGIFPYCVEEIERNKSVKFRSAAVGQDFLIVTFLLAGRLNYRFSTENRFTVVPGEILLIPPRTAYEFDSFGSQGGYRKLVFEISGKFLDQELYSLNLNHVIHRSYPDYVQKIAEIQEIGEMLSDILGNLPRLIGKTMEFLYSLGELGGGKVPSRLYLMAQNFIEGALAEPVDLNKLEDYLHVSRSTLGRLFRREAGISPREFWIGRKLHRAQYYLCSSNFSIKEIAALLGYSSQFHFTGEFKKHMGIPPTVFRENFQNENLPPNHFPR